MSSAKSSTRSTCWAAPTRRRWKASRPSRCRPAAPSSSTKVPGPFIRVRVGDTIDIHLKNSADSSMIHSVDFHATTGPGGGAAALRLWHQADAPAHRSMRASQDRGALLLPRFSVWVNQISRFGIRGPDDRLHLAIAELIEIARLHVLELRPDLARLRPFAIAPEAEAAGYGVELRLVHVCRELVVIEALRCRHSLRQH